MDISDITAADLQDDIRAPIINEENRKQVTKRMKDAGYMNIIADYVSSMFQDFDGYLRTEVDLVEDDIKLCLEEYNSSFITYELQPGIYTCKDISAALFKILKLEYPGPSNAIIIEFDDIIRKTKMVVRNGIIAYKIIAHKIC